MCEVTEYFSFKCPYCNGKTIQKYYKGVHILKCPKHFLIAEESLDDLMDRYEALWKEIEQYRKEKKHDKRRQSKRAIQQDE